MSTNNTTVSRMRVHTATRTINAHTDAVRKERYTLQAMAQCAISSAFAVCLHTRKAYAWRSAMTDSVTRILCAEVEDAWLPVLCDHVAREACSIDILDNISIFILRCELRSTAEELEPRNLTVWRAAVTLVLVADGDVIAKLNLSQEWTA